MTREEFDAYCASLAATTNVIQWGEASVWKVGGKIFAIAAGWDKGEPPKFSFKCSEMSYELLGQERGLRPAPYLARAKWIQADQVSALCDRELKAYIAQAHALIAAKLTKKAQADHGLVKD
ncbi:MAG: MmcQ/YjbR family DNA-binding protein [Maricaulis sp.]|jgi:predicted DNA-binding protein (MmcQ/YjbR family)|nr:MmcQ/YjbR family DNA-binding protein [Maricaulis sp.]MDG2044605.1 MmcQ/YjbR family DNA-binding protein [Maricaulis sp.]